MIDLFFRNVGAAVTITGQDVQSLPNMHIGSWTNASRLPRFHPNPKEDKRQAVSQPVAAHRHKPAYRLPNWVERCASLASNVRIGLICTSAACTA